MWFWSSSNMEVFWRVEPFFVMPRALRWGRTEKDICAIHKRSQRKPMTKGSDATAEKIPNLGDIQQNPGGRRCLRKQKRIVLIERVDEILRKKNERTISLRLLFRQTRKNFSKITTPSVFRKHGSVFFVRIRKVNQSWKSVEFCNADCFTPWQDNPI